jgi:hypothetical protein
MTLLKHRSKTRSSGSQGIPFWSLVLPSWAAVARAEWPPVRQTQPVTWTCARCGAVADDIGAAMEHINLHTLQDHSQPVSAVPERIRTGRRRRGARTRTERTGATGRDFERGRQ